MKKFNTNLTSDSPAVNVAIEALKRELQLSRKEQYAALKLILLNLYKYGEILIPRAKRGFGAARYNPHNVGYAAVNTVLNKLHKAGFIEQEIGSIKFCPEKGTTKTRTKITATDSIKDFLTKNGQWYRHEGYWFFYTNSVEILNFNQETIILRKDSKDKALLDYTDNDWTIAARQQLKVYNDFMEGIPIEAPAYNGDEYYTSIDEKVTRKFISLSNLEEFKYGGRAYASWCDLKKASRKRLRIDDCEVIEKDFQASSINTLYIHEIGQSYSEGDPYQLVIDNTDVPREITKKVSNLILFVRDKRSLKSALENHYSNCEASAPEVVMYQYCKASIGIDPIIEEFMLKHQTISRYFLQGKEMGLYVQFLESERVMNVVSELISQEIPVLTVYDSFIVQASYEDELEEVMNKYS